MEAIMIMININKLVGGSIVINTNNRNPAMTRLWWTMPRDIDAQTRDGVAYSDVAISGQLK